MYDKIHYNKKKRKKKFSVKYIVNLGYYSNFFFIPDILLYILCDIILYIKIYNRCSLWMVIMSNMEVVFVLNPS